MSDGIVSANAPTDTGGTADSGVEPLSDAAWESNSWDEPTSGEDKQAKFDREMEEMLAAEEAEADEDVERGDARKHVAKAKDDVQEVAAKATKRKAPEPEPEKAAPPTGYKVKLDGEEREIDAAKMARALGTTEAVLKSLEPGAAEKLYQKLWFAEQRQQQGTLAMKRFQEFVDGVKNPAARAQALKEFLAHEEIGADFRQVATEFLAREYEEMQLPPEQRELLAAKRQLEAIKLEQQRALQEAHAKQEQERRAAYAANLKADITKALGDAGIPTDTRMLRRIVDLMQRERAEDPDRNTPPSGLIPELEKELDADVELRFGALGVADFVARFPKIAKAIGQHQLAEARKRTSAGQFTSDPVETPTRRGPPKREKVSDLPWMK
jgi:hypothetical protein